MSVPSGQNTSVPPFDVGGLLPPLRAQFFRYNGSLTTPPCYQSVLWTVFGRRAQISMEQVSGGGVRQQTAVVLPDPFALLSDISPLTSLFHSAARKASGNPVLLGDRPLRAPGAELPSPAAAQSATGLCLFHPR